MAACTVINFCNFDFWIAGPHIGSPDHEPTSRIGPLQPSIEATTAPATTAKPAVAERVGRIDTGDSDPNKEADAVLKLLRNSKNRQGVQAIDLKMGCFTESPDTLSSDSAEKATGEGGSTGGLSRPGLQSLLMQVVGQVASYNERMTQETDNRKAIVKMLESYIKSQRDSLKRSETILNEYRVSLPKLS